MIKKKSFSLGKWTPLFEILEEPLMKQSSAEVPHRWDGFPGAGQPTLDSGAMEQSFQKTEESQRDDRSVSHPTMNQVSAWSPGDAHPATRSLACFGHTGSSIRLHDLLTPAH